VLPHEIIVVCKEGAIELMNRAHPDGCQPIPNPCQQTNRTCIDHVIQELSPRTVVGGIWNNRDLLACCRRLLPHIVGEASELSAWSWPTAGSPPHPRHKLARRWPTFGGIDVGPNDGWNPRIAIAWILHDEQALALHANTAASLVHELCSTQQNPRRDAIAGYGNLCLPATANRRVFVSTTGSLSSYGLLGRA